MKRALIVALLFLMAVGGCAKKKEEPKEEPVGELMNGKPVVVELATGSILRLELMMEEPDAYLLKGSGGTGRFPKVLVRRISDAEPERPVRNLPGQDLLKQKKDVRYVARTGGGIFHKLNCRQARHIEEDDRLEFETREEAIERGLKPCGVCNP